MTAYRLEYSRRFLRRLEQIDEYVAEHNSAAAARTVERILEVVGRLADFPAIGRPGRVEGTRELIVSGTPYIVPYRVSDDAVQVITIMHSAQRWPDHFP